MKALVYHGPGHRSWKDVPDPQLQEPTDFLVRMNTTTICGMPGLGADVAIEVVPATFELCTQLVRPGGHVVDVGVHGKPVTLPPRDALDPRRLRPRCHEPRAEGRALRTAGPRRAWRGNASIRAGSPLVRP